MKKLLSVILCVITVLSVFAPLTVFATDIHTMDIDLRADQLESDAYKYIENSLKYAKNNANENTPITVTLPSGEYKLRKGLHIYSNTKLVLQKDTVLIKDFEDGNMLKCGVKEESNKGYSGYTNITVAGGIWDENFCGDSCAMRFAHCSGVTIKNLTIKNNKNSHHLELAAAENFSILNCTFTGYKRTNGADGMAVQIDTMHSYTHFPDYYEYDDTPCKNVTVKGCTFENVYAGVGAYNGVIGCYFDSIVIKNNKYNNIKDKAIAAFNFINSTIYNNEINGATIGILFEYYPFEKLTNRFFMPKAGESAVRIITDSNTKIKGNTVNVVKSTSRSNSSGIAVYGGALSEGSAKSYGLVKGKYLVENLEISKNIINVKSSSSCGMWLQYLYNSSIKSNTVRALVKSDNGYNGITLKHSQLNTFNKNVIHKFDNSLALRSSSLDNSLTGNTLKNTAQYGIAADSTSSVIVNYGNTFRRNKAGRILLKTKKFSTYDNTVENLTVKDKQISWSKVKKVSGYKVFRSEKKKSGYTEIATIVGKKHTNYTDTEAEKGKKYYYKIAVFKSFNKSKIYGAYSDFVKIKY